ncbi:MAG: hypothetical protein ABIP54_03965, partial [Candidatus Andersenbacteria bacterium]
MDIRQLLAALAGIFIMAGYVPYIISIFKKKTVPAKASWLIWASLDTVLLYGMFLRHAVNYQILGTVLVIWIVVVLAFRYGKSGWTILDKFCLSATGVGIVLILVNPTWSIFLLAITSFIGAFPTFLNAWIDPTKEDKLTWTLYWISCVCTVIAVPVWSISSGA